LLDVGCGGGAFTIGAAHKGYKALGLSWDEPAMIVARRRASMCQAVLADFEMQDVRTLDRRHEFVEEFDIVVCCEVIEHIIDDGKLICDMARCLKPGGILLLTSPNFNFRAMTSSDNVLSVCEDGGHVRRGYAADDLRHLCALAGMTVTEIGFCSGFVSQKTTALMRTSGRIHRLVGWGMILPLRLLPPLLDPQLSNALRWPPFTITLVAARPFR
jgi:2-polyprenyl-3-methyl-5-hydroxy-6-metoxy-1,4-benzoquinol methylase